MITYFFKTLSLIILSMVLFGVVMRAFIEGHWIVGLFMIAVFAAGLITYLWRDEISHDCWMRKRYKR